MSDYLPDAWQMNNLTIEFFNCLDSRDYPGAIACFTEDGLWTRLGVPHRGHAAIKAGLESRPADMYVSHMVTNVQVKQHSATEGTVTFCMTGFPHFGAIPEGQFVERPPAHIVSICQQQMRKLGANWLITEMKVIRPIFRGKHKLS